MVEFIGLRSKLYSFTEHNTRKKVKKAKGVKKSVVDKEITMILKNVCRLKNL
jgi:hypothetical protein